MGRSPCCDKVGLKKGPWTPEEDQKLLAYIEEHGHGSWRALPAKAGLERCGKSCRLRWTNYLRPDIKRGKFSLQEEQTIIQLHALLGNRWSAIATHLPKRTDNEIKNYWNTHLKKRLAKMGIDPVTHKPKNDALLINDGHSQNAANLSHMAQWESARLEAEARLVREAKLSSYSFHHNNLVSKTVWSSAMDHQNSMTSTVVTATATAYTDAGINLSITSLVELVGTTSGSSDLIKDEISENDWKAVGNSSTVNLSEYNGDMNNSLSFTSSLHDLPMSMEGGDHVHIGNEVEEEGFTNLLLNHSIDQGLSDNGKDSENSYGSDYYDNNKNYWNSILNLVNSSPSDSPMF